MRRREVFSPTEIRVALLAALLPILASARSAARRTTCIPNLQGPGKTIERCRAGADKDRTRSDALIPGRRTLSPAFVERTLSTLGERSYTVSFAAYGFGADALSLASFGGTRQRQRGRQPRA